MKGGAQDGQVKCAVLCVVLTPAKLVTYLRQMYDSIDADKHLYGIAAVKRKGDCVQACC
jgi:hypothetical protein